MRVTVLGAALLLGACAGPMGPSMPGGGAGRMDGEINAFPGDESEKLLAGLDSAEAQAMRPGDAALTCAQLGQETVSIALDPKVQDVVQRMGGSPQTMMAELKKQQQQQMATTAAYMAVTVLSQVATRVPGLGLFTGVAQQTLGGALNAQQAAMNAQSAQKMAEITPILPQMMRGNRVQQLAEAKSCAFLKKPA